MISYRWHLIWKWFSRQEIISRLKCDVEETRKFLLQLFIRVRMKEKTCSINFPCDDELWRCRVIFLTTWWYLKIDFKQKIFFLILEKIHRTRDNDLFEMSWKWIEWVSRLMRSIEVLQMKQTNIDRCWKIAVNMCVFLFCCTSKSKRSLSVLRWIYWPIELITNFRNEFNEQRCLIIEKSNSRRCSGF